jgi:hypothetical protein
VPVANVREFRGFVLAASLRWTPGFQTPNFSASVAKFRLFSNFRIQDLRVLKMNNHIQLVSAILEIPFKSLLLNQKLSDRFQ